jgi:hypothetical protein
LAAGQEWSIYGGNWPSQRILTEQRGNAISAKTLHRIFAFGYGLVGVLFSLSGLAVVGMAAIQLWQGVNPGGEASLPERLAIVLDGIAVLTVAVAALELGETIIQERVLRETNVSAPTRVRRFLSRFLVVVVVALAIEALILVFRLGHESPAILPSAAAVALAAAGLLAAWGFFVRQNRSAEELEPEAIEEARKEDKEVEE